MSCHTHRRQCSALQAKRGTDALLLCIENTGKISEKYKKYNWNAFPGPLFSLVFIFSEVARLIKMKAKKNFYNRVSDICM